MSNQFEQDKDVNTSAVAKRERLGLRTRLARRMLLTPVLALAALLPATALAAVDLQVTDFSDSGYDPIAAGSTVHYSVTVDNGDTTVSGPVAVLFDLPSGTALAADAPSYCTATSTLMGSRVTCLLPAPPAANGTSPRTFQLPVTTLDADVGAFTVNAAVGLANALPDLESPLSSLPSSELFFGGEANTGNNKFSQTTTLTAATNLGLTKTASPASVPGGGEITYTMTVTNKGPSIATGFIVEDALPPELTFVAGSANGADWSFVGPNGTYGKPLAVGATAIYTFRAKVNAESGTVLNPAEVKTGAGQPIDPATDDNKSSAATTVTAGADLTLEKTPDPSIVAAGELVTFTLRVRNNGPSAATNVTLTDAMPAGFVIVGVAPAPAGWTCGANPDGTQLDCAVPSLSANAGPVEIKVTAQVPTTGPNSVGMVTNTATVVSSVDDPEPGNNSGSTSLQVLPDGADLAMAKSKAPVLVPVWTVGQPKRDSMMTSTMTVANRGPRAVTGDVQIVDLLAVGEKLVNATGDDIAPNAPFDPDGTGTWRCVASPYLAGTRQKVTCDLLTGYSIASGASSPTLTLHTLALAAGALTNSACTGGGGAGDNQSKPPLTAGGINLDPNLQNNCAGGESKATQQYADLSIQKRTNGPGDTDNMLPVGQDTVQFTLTVTNAATSGATGGMIVADPIPGYIPGVTTVTGSVPTGWSCGMESNVWTCRSGVGTTLAPGASVDFTVTVRRGLLDSVGVAADTRCGATAGRHCNVAAVRIDPTHPDALGELNGGKYAADWVAVAPVTNIGTRKAITAGNPGRVGTESEYQITYNNDKTSSAPGVIFRDTFTLKGGDAGFVLVSAVRTGAGGATCAVVTPLPTGIVQAQSPVSGQFSYSNTGAGDAKLTISCPAIDMARGATETMSVVIRPNIDSGNSTGRSLFNEADFTFTGPSSGADFDYNSNTSDDKDSATLFFDHGSVDLITNKEDQGFTGGIDPLGFDSRPGNESNNRLIYRIAVTNNGPSLATNVHFDDTIVPPSRASGIPVGLEFVGSMTGQHAGPTGALEPPSAAARCYGTSSNGTSTTLGEPISIRCRMPPAGNNVIEEGVLANGATSYLYLVYEYKNAPPGSGETLSNSATANSAERESNDQNNTSTQTTSIRSRVDLAVVKTAHELQPASIPSVALPADAGPLSLRQKFWYVMEVVNNGPGHALTGTFGGVVVPGAKVEDTLPAGLEVMGGANAITWEKTGSAITSEPTAQPNGSGTCTLVGNVVTCVLGDMSVDGHARILVPVRWITYPAGGVATNTAEVTTSQIDSNPENNKDDVVVTVVRSSIAGTVFYDRDRAASNGGIKNGVDTGISGFKLTLTGLDFNGDNIESYLTLAQRQATTANDGSFRIGNLPPAGAAGYTLLQTQDAKYINGDFDPPSTGAEAASHGGVYAQVDASNPRTSHTHYSAIVLPKGVDAVNYNFPEIRRPTLSGYVFVDMDEDDVRTTGANADPAIPGATVTLQSSTGTQVQTKTTDSNGRYQFLDLDPLVEYVLVQPLPVPNYVNRPSAVRAGAFNSAACATGFCAVGNTGDVDTITRIDMSAGVDGVNFNFGEQALSHISGYVYVDRDADGKFDPAKDNDVDNTGTSRPNGGLQGIDIVLTPYDRSGTALATVTVTTDANGYYEFLDRQAGLRYTLHQSQQPTGYADAAENPITAPINIPVLKVNGATGNNFGEKLASLQGFVYEDYSSATANNNNGAKDAGENPIAGVTLTLSGSDVNGQPVNRTATSDLATGAYRFGDLLQGTYTVTETQPAAYEDGKHTAGNATTPGSTAVANVISAIGLNAGQDATGYLFGELKKTRIAGTVYLDLDDSGTQDGSDPGIAGVVITLEVEATPGNWTAVVAPQPIVTDNDGHYSYDDGVIGRNYRITETQPVGLADGRENNSNVITITNLPVTGSEDNHFGEKAATLSGVVYLDRNGNGVQDGAEPGLDGVVMTLSGAAKDALGNALPMTVTTAGGGLYAFNNLLAGTYTVQEQATQPNWTNPADSKLYQTFDGITVAGTVDGTANGGTATAQDTTPSSITGIVLPAGKDTINNNFGEVLRTAISGSVYVDRKADGVFTADDAGTRNSAANGGVAGVTVELHDGAGTRIAVTTTDATGAYRFDDLMVDLAYRVVEIQPAGYANGLENSSNEIVVASLALAGLSDQNFGEKLGSLAGFVYEDFSAAGTGNNNGQYDTAHEQPIGNVSVKLTGTAANNQAISYPAIQTGNDGSYLFVDLLEGEYILTETQPAAYIDGKHTPGNATQSGSNAVANIISGIGLGAGQEATGYLFGELANAPISGTVYIDRNDDGKQDAGENGIPNVSITIEVEESPGNWVKVPGPAIVTDSDGHYTYPDAVTGKNYRVTETQPTNLGDGKENGTVNTGTPNVITINNLPAGGSTGNNYGEITAVLSGVVYLDSNNNGAQDNGEPGLPGVDVELPAGTVNALGVVVAKATTNAAGEYRFIDLLAGTYTVTEQLVQPSYGGAVTSNGKTTAGTTGGTATDVKTVPSAISGITLAAGGMSEGNNFGEVLVAGIAGTVYVDRNDNGSFDAADAGAVNSAANGGIEKVWVVLYAADGSTELMRVETDAQGNYAFANLPTGVDYVVKELQPAGYAEGKEHPTNEISIAQLPLNGSAGNNFGETLGALAGHVYEDFSATTAGNNNGVKDAGEKAIEGVTLTLSGTDKSGNIIATRTTTTDSDGRYSFGDLLEGTYTITETQPSGYEDGKHTAGNATIAGTNAVANILGGIGLDAGQKADGYLFGELKKAPISGTVYVDRNDNGDQDGSELGLPGVEIVITSNGPDGKPGGDDDVNVTITTDKDGNYSWPDAIAGVDYTITQKQPIGLADGKENTSNVITITNLPASGSQDNNFGEIAAVLSGVVYLDSNNNGVQDSGEPGLPNVEVELPAGTKNAAGQAVTKALTDAAGKYQFIDLLAGTYKVTQQAEQPSWNGTITANGITQAGTTGGTATGVNTVPSAITGITLVAGGKSEDNNFGEVLQVSVAGTVFLDVDNDGAIAGVGEIGLAGVTIELNGVDDTGATVSLTTATDKDGKFNFDGLRPGKYSLTEPTQPTGTANGITTAGAVDGVASGTATPVTTVPSRIADIDLSKPGSASVDNLFGEIPRSSGITGKVWVDTDNDGVIDPDEKGIAGVTVELEGTAIDGTPITVTVTTDADGNYSFTDLPPGTYTVTEPTQPPGTLDGKTVPGTTGGTATTPGTPPSKISTIKVGVNETSSDNNFGEIPVGSIAGFVYNDSNDDGIKQADEGGYALVDVVLTGTDDLGNPVNVSGKTDVQGHYVFENLRPGTYVVTEPTQPAETLNGLTTAGTIEGVKSNAKVTGKETTPSEIDGIVLKPGSISLDNNFGEIGDSPDMLVSKSSTTVKFTVNNVATYTIRVRNGGQQASEGEYIVKDRLPVGLNLAEVPSGNGWTCSGAVGDARFECRSSEVLNAGVTSTSDITVKVNVTAEAAKAGTVNNAVLVEGGGENEFRTPTTTERSTFDGDVTDLPVCDTAITQNVCRVPNEVQLAASVGGTVWFDIGSEDTHLDGGDERLQSWIVELLDAATGTVSKTTTTAVDGSYRFGDVVPGVKWNLQFRDPSSGVLWAWPVNQETAGGIGVACDGSSAISGSSTSACRVTENGTSQLQVVLEAGQHLPQQSLPVDPSGVVYDAVTRDPVPGSIVTLAPVGVCNGYDPMAAILNAAAGGYKVEGNAVSMTVGNNGYYQFMFGPAAPARCEFQLTVTPPGGYQFVSKLITPESGSLSPLGAVGSSHLVQPQSNAPTGAVGTPTQYWLNVFAGSATAGIVRNHIPLDTAEATGLVITKTGDRQTAEIGDTVQYTITVRQTAGSAMATLNIVDTLPRGFTYIDGTARVGGRALEEPFGKPGPRLGFNLGPINVGQQLVLTYRVRVGVGAQQGDGINRAQAHGCSITGGCIDPGSMTPVPGSVPSNRAEYRVRVTGGVFTEEACVLGKVFVDCNNNHLQDNEELGIPGVRLYFSNGTWVISDSEGKYSYCGLTPQSHTLKVDASTLPSGSRLTTSSNRNLGDADSLFLDLKNGELHRADFIEGSCSNPLLEQVKARRTQGEVRAPETETGQSQLRFDSKPARAPQQATDSANQRPIVHPRPNPPSAAASQEVQP